MTTQLLPANAPWDLPTRNIINAGLSRLSDATFSAHMNGSNQLSISATLTLLTFGTTDWNVGGFYNTATSLYTPPSGKHCLTACVRWLGTNAVDQELLGINIRKNGVDHRAQTLSRSGATAFESNTVSIIVDANGTDTFGVYAIKTGAGAGDINGTATVTYFQGAAVA